MTKNFWGTPLIASEHGAGLDGLTWYIHGLMLLLFIGWSLYFLYVLFRFRQRKNAQADHAGVQNHLSSLDVIHSFKVFPMRVNQDAIPGMSVPIHFKPTMPGSYPINCAQLCGVGHYSMKGVLKVLTQPEYDAWLKSKAGAGAVSY